MGTVAFATGALPGRGGGIKCHLNASFFNGILGTASTASLGERLASQARLEMHGIQQMNLLESSQGCFLEFETLDPRMGVLSCN